MKNKGTVALLVALIVFSTVSALIAVYPSLTAPAYPKQVYEPTLPAADERVVCIVFDDGWKSQLNAVPILESYDFSATFAIVTSYPGYPAYMSWADIAGIAQRGNDIASHTLTHMNLSSTDEATLKAELEGSQQALRLKGYAANVLVYPYGAGSDNATVQAVVAQYYLAARGTQAGKCDMATFDRYSINAYDIYHNTTLADFGRLLNGTQGSNVAVLYYHKIGNENLDTAVTPETFQAQMQYLKDNGYTVKTLSELLLKEAPKD